MRVALGERLLVALPVQRGESAAPSARARALKTLTWWVSTRRESGAPKVSVR